MFRACISYIGFPSQTDIFMSELVREISIRVKTGSIRKRTKGGLSLKSVGRKRTYINIVS